MFYNLHINFGAISMNDIVFSTSAKNLTFSLIYDQDCASPREDNDGNISHFYVDPRNRSGCVDNLAESTNLLNELAKELKIADYYDLSQFDLIREIQNADPEQKKILVEPLYKFEHSGIMYATTPFSCPWDSGQVGFIFSTYKDFKRVGLEWDTEKAKEYLKGEVELYNNYIAGECFGFKIEEVSTCGSCTADHSEELEAVWGYVGDRDQIIKMIASDYLDPYPSLKEKVLESV